MSFASTPGLEPMSEMNTTPLIDVLLMLLIMFFISIPVAPHEVQFDLPNDPVVYPRMDRVKDVLVATGDDRILWNGETVTPGQLPDVPQATRTLPTEPELQFAPEGSASYALSARALREVEASGVTRFGFVGDERFREFDR